MQGKGDTEVSWLGCCVQWWPLPARRGPSTLWACPGVREAWSFLPSSRFLPDGNLLLDFLAASPPGTAQTCPGRGSQRGQIRQAGPRGLHCWRLPLLWLHGEGAQ